MIFSAPFLCFVYLFLFLLLPSPITILFPYTTLFRSQMEMLAPHTVFVQAKTYYGGGRYYTIDIDYNRIAEILRNAEYRGYVSIEFEGYEESEVAVAETISLLRNAFDIQG